MEWTKEQREQAAELLIKKFHPGIREGSAMSYWVREFTGPCSNKSDAIDLQCELTAALSEIERLKSEQMGELAVGGADELYELVHSAKHILEDVEMGIDRTPQVTEWLDRQRNIPAPPSGEQAAAPLENESETPNA